MLGSRQKAMSPSNVLHRVTTYDLRGHGYSDVTPNHYTAADMVEDLRCLLDALGIEKPILVGHSFGADIALYFSLLYPERVPKLVALEPGLAALVHLRQDKDWIGWAAWVAKLEEAGIHVPEDRRTDAEYLLQLSLETPKFYGPARGLPRNREPLPWRKNSASGSPNPKTIMPANVLSAR